MKIDIMGVMVDSVSVAEAITKIDSFVQSGQSHFIATPYSEMIVFASDDEIYRHALNSASLSLPDGMGIVFAAKLLGVPVKERVSGRLLVYDLAALAQEKNYSLALVGGDGNVAAQAAYNLKLKYPNLKINLAISGKPFDDQIIKEINDSNSDILLIAYSPPRQELWLANNYQNLNTKVAIGLGGTFDYLAGKRLTPPKFMHSLGLEWLWRLVTQPWRVFRIWNATVVFSFKLLIYKFHGRKN